MQKIAVIFGGRSAEHDISIITGQFIISALEATGEYKPLPIYIDKQNRWHHHPKLGKLKTFQDTDFKEKLSKFSKSNFLLDGRFEIVGGGLLGKRQKVDVVFPAMHGTYGEDGSLMGLLELSNTPFVGCGVSASAVAMDKVICKMVTSAANVPSVPYVWFTAEQYEQDAGSVERKIEKDLKKPWFVKPAHLGSSIAVTKVTDNKYKLKDAIELALHYDDKVIVEEGVEDLTEVNCAVLGNGKEIKTSMLEQPLHKEEFLSFKDKYVAEGVKDDGGSMSGAKDRVKIPAPISDEQTSEIQELAKEAFHAIDGSGTARLDFMIDNKSKKVYLNEINPLPGSLQQHLWKASGVSNVELVSELVLLAQERFSKQQSLTSTFKSSVLQQSSGTKNHN